MNVQSHEHVVVYRQNTSWHHVGIRSDKYKKGQP